jgi:hypothetical protein
MISAPFHLVHELDFCVTTIDKAYRKLSYPFPFLTLSKWRTFIRRVQLPWLRPTAFCPLDSETQRRKKKKKKKKKKKN